MATTTGRETQVKTGSELSAEAMRKLQELPTPS